MGDALQMLGLPGAALRVSGRLSACNSLFEALIPTTVEDRLARLTLVNKNADVLLERALASGIHRATEDGVTSIAIPATQGRVPLIIHLVPVLGAGQDIFSQAAFVAVVTPIDRGAVPTANVLQGLFDLTPAEARVARAIAEGDTIADIAPSLGVAEGTIRTQLKAVLAKTGLHRQAELVALLAGSALPHIRQ
jgi:DNA-binding CsgD family transcriptional regulator